MVERGSHIADDFVAGELATPTGAGPDGARLWFELRVAETLARVGAALVSELDLQRVLAHVTDAAMDLTGAEFGSFIAAGTTDADLSFLHTPTEARPEPFAELVALVPANGGMVRLDDVTDDPRYAAHPLSGELMLRSYLAVPVVSRSGEALGGLVFGHSHPGMFTALHERLVAGIAGPAAIAIDNARLYRTAKREREEAERLAARLAQVQALSAGLAGAKAVDDVAAVVVQSAPAALGCRRASFFRLDPDGRTLALLHSVGYEGALHERWATIDAAEPLPATDALRERRVVTIADEAAWAAQYPNAAPGEDRSVALAVIPFALGEQAFGIATFGWDAPRAFGEDERQFLEALSDQCSQALERARLYEMERETAHTLQSSLLPPRAPEIPGMEVAAVFRAGDRSVAVGGDFYDVFQVAPNRWGVAMGDVCGRGARAAARTALVRYTLRALGKRDDRPSEILRDLNVVVLAEPEADDRFCATVFGRLELDRCGAWVTLSCAGHPRPIVVRRAGWIDTRGQVGTLIGVIDDLDVSDDRVGLGPGDSLVFFTDGISEARNAQGELFAEEGLPETLLSHTGAAAGDLAEAVRAAALAFTGGSLADDVALLVVRVPEDAGDAPDSRLRDALGPDAVPGSDISPGYPVPHGGQRTRPAPPREARMALPAEPGSARAARRFLAGVLSSWRIPEMLEGDTALLLSELATNAILHAQSAFTVIIRFDGTTLRIEVGDGSRSEPRLRALEREDAPGGRGLMLIDTVSSGWGILPTAKGKRVWFELPVPAPHG